MTFKLIKHRPKKDFYQANAKLPNELNKAIRRGAYISGKQLVADLKADMKKPKSGRTYTVYSGIGGKALKRPRLHKASSASETPAVISGEFRKSIDFKVRGNRGLEFGSGNEGLAKEYARALELGTSRMAARKPLGRTVKKLQNKTQTNVTKEINKAIEGTGCTIRRF